MALAKPSQLPLHRHIRASPFFPPCTPSYEPWTRPSSSNLSPLRCRASSPPSSGECRAAQIRRRSVSISTALLLVLFPHQALAGGGGGSGVVLDKYVKKKKLDPLDAYVLAVILTQLQIEDLGKTLESDDPEFAFCRSLLRAGPAASLHVNIRAVAQYASERGDGNTAFYDIDRCLRKAKFCSSVYELKLLCRSLKKISIHVVGFSMLFTE